ncbi:hypothetical protein [Abyssalbus ytuae]|uniref:Uncharacterized protein n=1 Tax=Abyssalbus ytuae TaxID=2926907 RepID=A0A9E7D110_9FLAO|nr:hypothetical protein [Abyssalbus ytuae]UOB16568.1 hypothetical protein MQE35_12585 [Abyssalbus ytuae]
MIVFQSDDFEIDLSVYGLTLNEESNSFKDNIIKSYSLPFTVDFDDDIFIKLGFPNIENITSFESIIKGKLIVDDKYFEAEIIVGEIIDESIELTLYYGEEVLKVYSSELKSLPWPVIIKTSLKDYAKSILNKSWPDVSHNFPKIFRHEIKEKNDYENFEYFVNNYNGSSFVDNIIDDTGEEILYLNKNVMAPCPYLLEIVRMIYRSEGKKVRGDIFNHPILKKTIYIPENYFEYFKGNTFDSFQFDRPDRNNNIDNNEIGIYEKIYPTDNLGSYKIKYNINLDPVLASYFNFRIFQVDSVSLEETIIFQAFSENNRVNISDEVTVNVDTNNQFNPIKIELTLKNYSGSISQYNSFEFAYQESRLNVFPNSYSLSDFMPDMTCGEFINAIKNWLNIDIKIKEDYVYINFLKDDIINYDTEDHSHLQDIKPRKKRNKERIFKLIYANKKEIIVDYSGQIYSDVDKRNNEEVKIEMEVQNAIIEQNYDIITAVYPEDNDDGLIFSIYDGLKNNQNVCLDFIEGKGIRIEDIYNELWKEWLHIRTNNFTFNDKFICHISDKLSLRSYIYKYNHKLLPVSFNKKRISQEFWEVDMQAETF